MRSMREFFSAVLSEWGSGVTGGLSAPLFIWAIVWSSGVPRIAALTLAVVCLYVASYRVWKKERKAREVAESRLEDATVKPELLFEYATKPAAIMGDAIKVLNIGSTAVISLAPRLIIFGQPGKSGTVTIAFRPDIIQHVLPGSIDKCFSFMIETLQRDESEGHAGVLNTYIDDFLRSTKRDSLEIVCDYQDMKHNRYESRFNLVLTMYGPRCKDLTTRRVNVSTTA